MNTSDWVDVTSLEKWLIKQKSSCSSHFGNISKYWALFHPTRIKIVHSIGETYLFSFSTSKCSLQYWHLLCWRRRQWPNSASTIMDIWRNWCAYLLYHYKFIERLRHLNWFRIARNLLRRVSWRNYLFFFDDLKISFELIWFDRKACKDYIQWCEWENRTSEPNYSLFNSKIVMGWCHFTILTYNRCQLFHIRFGGWIVLFTLSRGVSMTSDQN